MLEGGVVRERRAAVVAVAVGRARVEHFAGAAEQLREALLVNPYDTEGTAAAILLALQMPLEERRSRHEALMRTVRQYDVHWWCDSFLDALVQAQPEETGIPWLRL